MTQQQAVALNTFNQWGKEIRLATSPLKKLTWTVMGQKKGWPTWELPESEVKGNRNWSLVAGSCIGPQLFQVGLRAIIPQRFFFFSPPKMVPVVLLLFTLVYVQVLSIFLINIFIYGYENGWNVITDSQALLMSGPVGAQYCCSASWSPLHRLWLQIPSPAKDGSTRTSAIMASLVRNGRGWRWDVHPNLCHWLKAALSFGHFEAVT